MATGIALLEFTMIVGVVLIAVLAAFNAIALLSSGRDASAKVPKSDRNSYGIYMPKKTTLSGTSASQGLSHHV